MNAFPGLQTMRGQFARLLQHRVMAARLPASLVGLYLIAESMTPQTRDFGINFGFMFVVGTLGVFALSIATSPYRFGGASDKRKRSSQQGSVLHQEMAWLYGDDWPTTTGYEEGQLVWWRIRRRWIGRIAYSLYALAFTVLYPLISVFWVGDMAEYHIPELNIYFVFTLAWLYVTLRIGYYAFPTWGTLRRREQAFGRALARRTGWQPSVTPKNDALDSAAYVVKMKRGLVRLSDDGELIDLTAERDSTEPRAVKGLSS